jgi:hypothetical protein
MAEPLDPKEIVSIEELTISNMYEIEALIEVLVKKGMVSKDDVLEEIKKMRGRKQRWQGSKF